MQFLKALPKLILTLAAAATFTSLDQARAFTGFTSENFTTSTYKDAANTTAVWNLVTNSVHPPFTVCINTVPPCTGNDETFDVDIGTGSDGPFDVPYYSNFGTITGTPGNYTIVINTNTHPFFNFTTFNLAAGYTIAPVGSSPLWFKVQGNFTNSGLINCSGGNGGDISTNTANGGAGGVGICGGGNGGNGGSTSSPDGSPGVDGGTPACTHGSGGTHSSTSNQSPFGGGGGGSFGTAAAAGSGNGFVAGSGSGGTSTNDFAFANLFPNGDMPGAGSGGGGGGSYIVLADPFNSSGAGGGAGGGAIHIAVGGNFTQNSGAQILAFGGNGGNSNVAVNGGPGGGGGGGTIAIHVFGTFTDNGPVGGSIMADQGLAGNPSHVAGFASTAGAGSVGREWLAPLPTGPGFEHPAYQGPQLGAPGVVHYKTEGFVLQTVGYDALNTSPTFTLFNQTVSLPGTSTAILQIAGSNDNFIHDNTGFVPFTSSATLVGKRFFRFRDAIQLAPGGGVPANAPVAVTNISATYSGVQSTNFQFGPACGTFGSPGEFFFDIFLCFFFGLISTGRLRKGKLFRRSKTNPAS